MMFVWIWCVKFLLLSFCIGHEVDLRAYCNDSVHHNSTPRHARTSGSWLQIHNGELTTAFHKGKACRLDGNCILASAALYVKGLTQNEQVYITTDSVYSIQDAWRRVFPGVIKEGTCCCSSESCILIAHESADKDTRSHVTIRILGT